LVGSLLFVFGINLASQQSEQAAIMLLFGFGVLIGLATAPTVAYYASADPHGSLLFASSKATSGSSWPSDTSHPLG
jgi:hypothetical protein